MTTEIITIGDELLLGQVIDTNSAWLGQILFKNNISVDYKTAIKDQESAIINQLKTSLERSELIIITGGLGPTKDDITKKTLAQFFNMAWRIDQNVLKQLEQFFEKRGRQLLEINKIQAELPDQCETLENQWGTAPGMWFNIKNKIIISLPGVPYEMKNIFEHVALPKILKHFSTPILVQKTILTFNVPESLLAQQIEAIENNLPKNIGLAYLPNLNCVRLRLTGESVNKTDVAVQIDDIVKQIIRVLGKNVISEKDTTLVEIIYDLLKNNKKTLSLAESCTGGLISHQLTALPGSSSFFVGSVVSYSNSVKHHQLGVENTLFETVGAVSEQVVEQMAKGVRERLKTDYSIAVSGIAGPSGGSKEKPVGTVVIGVSSVHTTRVKKYHLIGDRENVIGRSSNHALNMLRELILEEN